MAFHNTPETTTAFEYDSTGSIVLAIVVIIYLFLLAYLLITYIFKSISLYKIAKDRGIQNPILAWIPVASEWLVGKIADHADEAHGKKSKWATTLLVLSLIPIVIFVLMYIVAFMSIIGAAISIGMTESAASNMEDAQAAMIVLSVFIPIFIFAFIAEMVTLANMSVQTICVYKILDSCDPKNSLKNLLIYLLVPFAAPFVLFACRNKHWGIPREFMPQMPQLAPRIPVDTAPVVSIETETDDKISE